MVTRREVTAGLVASAAAGISAPAIAQAKPRIVVVGGGAGGASAVRRLSQKAGNKLAITLVEPKTVYTTCFYSNLYLGGIQSLDTLQFNYSTLGKLPGVTLAAVRAARVDREARLVRLENGAQLPYDRLVLSPGISLDYTSVPGWSKEAEAVMPHAWQSGEQAKALKQRFDAVPDGGLIVVIAPPNPSRCPPAPYERVSMMAHALQKSGRKNTRIVILDPKDKYPKQALFQQAWEQYYPGMIEWMPPMIFEEVKAVIPQTMTVETGFETYEKADLVNVIPRQTAGQIAVDAHLTADNGFCPTDPFTMKSLFDGNIFVLGDASIAGDMPKSAHAASSQARAAADIIIREFLMPGAEPLEYRSRCWSQLGAENSVFVAGRYQPTEEKIKLIESEISSLTDSAETRRQNYRSSAAWYSQLTGEMFG